MNITFIVESDLALIRDLAIKIWPEAYRQVLSEEQIKFMLNEGYKLDSLQQQVRQGDQFIVARENGKPLGFASYKMLSNRTNVRIQKLYVMPDSQKKGVGRTLLQFIEKQAKLSGAGGLELNVNRRNPAVNFYLAAGFAIRESTDIPYFNWVLDDYIMEKRIRY